MDSFVSTYTKRRAVYETYAGTFSQKHLYYKIAIGIVMVF